jgi:hypothetical protein
MSRTAAPGKGSRNVEDYTEEFVKAVAAKTPKPVAPAADAEAVNVRRTAWRRRRSPYAAASCPSSRVANRWQTTLEQ